MCFAQNDERSMISSWVAIRSVCRLAGMTPSHLLEIRGILFRSYERSGLRGFATLIKAWSNTTRSILSRHRTKDAGYCKIGTNCLNKLRKEGFDDAKIDEVVRVHGNRNIPPFLLFREFGDCLVENPRLEDYIRAATFANLGRAAPVGNRFVIQNSVDKFKRTITREPGPEFDLTKPLSSWAHRASLSRCSMCDTSVSTSTSSSREYSRGKGGKNKELFDKIIEDFMEMDIDELIPEPSGPVFDICGNVICTQDSYEPGVPIRYQAFPEIRESPGGVDLIGLFALWWAVRSALSTDSLIVTSNSVNGSFTEPPEITYLGGHLESRVEPVEESGWKCRVITITDLDVYLIQIACRHLLDPMIYGDVRAAIGLSSATKLYDFMRHLNYGGIRGLDSQEYTHLQFSTCISVDLTTATDSPYRWVISQFFQAIEQFNSSSNQPLVKLASITAKCPRRFTFPDGSVIDPSDHKNGLMMGEGLSGLFLNGCTAVVHYLVRRSVDWLPYYGVTVGDADRFIRESPELIQEFLDGSDEFDFGETSCQSGDDLIDFNDLDPQLVSSRYMLMYRILGFQPSEDTWYASRYFGTFTEEMCVRTHDSNGWTFCDVMKARYFLPDDTAGLPNILSRLDIVANKSKYYKDEESIFRIMSIVDEMISDNKVLRDRISRYSLIKGLPEFMGGINHPCSHLVDFTPSLDERTQQILDYMSKCPDGEFLEMRYAFLANILTDEKAEEARSKIRCVYNFLQHVEPSTDLSDDSQDFFSIDKILGNRQLYSWSAWLQMKRVVSQSFGLINFSTLVSKYISSEGMWRTIDGEESLDSVNPLIARRNTREKLEKLVPKSWVRSGIDNTIFRDISLRMRGCDHIYFRESDINILLDLPVLPSLKVSVQAFA